MNRDYEPTPTAVYWKALHCISFLFLIVQLFSTLFQDYLKKQRNRTKFYHFFIFFFNGFNYVNQGFPFIHILQERVV